MQWNWDFGSGTPQTTSSPIATKTYDTAGTYLVTLTVTNNLGQTSNATKSSSRPHNWMPKNMAMLFKSGVNRNLQHPERMRRGRSFVTLRVSPYTRKSVPAPKKFVRREWRHRLRLVTSSLFQVIGMSDS